MKYLIAAFLSMAGFSAFANQGLSQMKQLKLNSYDERITKIKEAKTCVINAQNEKNLEKCTTDLNAEMSMMKQDVKESKKMLKEAQEEPLIKNELDSKE